ncbi:MAG: methionyl-tRNA formyltransferase [Nitrospiria bacterium]
MIFMGTPDFAVPALDSLVQSEEEIIRVVTQPDRPKGRKQILTPSPVKLAAEKYHLPILQPERIKDADFIKIIKTLSPEVMIIVAFGQILPPVLLNIPRLGCINVHASLLPKYRGAAPVHWAIINGEKETGVTTMLLDAGLDTGPMLRTGAIPILGDDTGVSLSQKLSVLGAKVLMETLEDLKNGRLRPIPQDPQKATYAPILKKKDGEVRWDESAERIERKARALTFWPGMYTYHDRALLKLTKIEAVEGLFRGETGEVLGIDKGSILIATGEGGALKILEVQPENGIKMTISQYLAGHPMKKGERLGEK